MMRKQTIKTRGTKQDQFKRDKDQILLPREKIFNKIFEGKDKKLRFNQMFSTITTYTPTGMKREMPHTKRNMDLYNKFLLKQKEKRALWEEFQ